MRLPTNLDSDDGFGVPNSTVGDKLHTESQHQIPTGELDGDEFTLAPVQAERPTMDTLPGPNLRFDSPEMPESTAQPHVPRGYRVPETAKREATFEHTPGSQPTQLSSPIDLPPHRAYPTLESIGRLYKLFGYVGVVGIFGYLLYQFFAMVWRSPEGEFLTRLVAFSEFALPFVFGTVVGAGALFAASEGIQLVIDIQENTLRAAHKARSRAGIANTGTRPEKSSSTP